MRNVLQTRHLVRGGINFQDEGTWERDGGEEGHMGGIWGGVGNNNISSPNDRGKRFLKLFVTNYRWQFEVGGWGWKIAR